MSRMGFRACVFAFNATIGLDGDIEDTLVYVPDVDEDDLPLNVAQVPRAERNHIKYTIYLPDAIR